MKRTLLTLAATVAMGVTLWAQGAPDGAPQGPRGNPFSRLKNALGLNDAQVQAITNVAQSEKASMQKIMTDIQQKRQALNALLNSASPNANDVGNAAIALHAAEGKIGPERTYFINQIKAQLTGEQQQKLDTLLAANGGRFLPFPGLGGPGLGGPGGRFYGPGPRQH
jgi:Spy/CpxP family protein refolding chaperone